MSEKCPFSGDFRAIFVHGTETRQNARISQNRRKMAVLGRFLAISNNNNHMIKVELIC